LNIELIDAAAVRARLPMKRCIEAMRSAMRAVSEGSLVAPRRVVMPLADGSGHLFLMPGSIREPPLYGAKLISLHPGNPAAGRPAIQGFVALFDAVSGAPVALIDGAEITALRTAAASALATDLLARPDARTLGILGASVQATSHLEAMALVRNIAEVRVWTRSSQNAAQFVAGHARAEAAPLRAVASAAEAAACDIVCVVTGAHEPVIRGGWLRPGSHVNLVGAHTASARESDTDLIVRSRLYVDSIDSAFSEAGDILIPLAQGAIARSHVVGEIGAVLLGRIGGRGDAREITVYKSLGLVAQDLFAAHAVYSRGAATV
jgi:ornithine cyclodeaminase/alanine dehydrogenase-like protein (mu-crystallin family)